MIDHQSTVISDDDLSDTTDQVDMKTNSEGSCNLNIVKELVKEPLSSIISRQLHASACTRARARARAHTHTHTHTMLAYM